MDFDAAFAILINPNHEGTYANNPADPGGETMYGVTKRIAQEEGYTGDMHALPLDVAKSIAKRRYWDTMMCDSLPDFIRYELFDFAYNAGVGQATKALQRAAHVVPDGAFGPGTLAAVTALAGATPGLLFRRFIANRIRFYTSLETFNTFGRGWMNRIAANFEET